MPLAELHPINPDLSPLSVGDKVAFNEDHKKHPAMYGVISAIGLDSNGNLTFDLNVIDPTDGTVDSTTFRANLGDIQ
jgi:hypothetical protein